MRILKRPMFRYGGPINEGIMHGMRNGGRAAALVGNPIFPKDSSGRAHHVWQFAVPAVRALAGFAMGQGGKKLGQKAIQEGIKKGTTTAAANPGFWKSIYQQDPMVRGSKWLWNALRSPKAKSWGESAVKGLLSPTSLALSGGITWYMWPDGTKRKTPPPGGRETGVPGGGDPGMTYTKPPVTKSAEELAAEAKAARTKKLNKYLDTMGYDKAKKTAMGDALIDASAIVQDATTEAGSLKKADWGKMINRAIQSTSKRLDKPDQIREAVGLMLTKSEIEKDLEDPQVKRLRALNIQDAEEKLDRGFEKDMRDFILARKDAPSKDQIERFARLTADEYEIDFTKVTDKQLEAIPEGASQEEIISQVVTGDGIYMIGDAIVRVTDGIPKHIG